MKVSVLVPVYNAEKYIGRCLRSLHHQSIKHSEYEVIVVNDASTDLSGFIARQFEGWIKYVEHKNNLGLPSALNSAMQKSYAEYIVRVDADDYVNEHYLLILTEAIMTNPEMDAFCCDYYRVDNDERVLSRKNSRSDPIGCGIIFSKSIIDELGGYDENFLINEERELMKRFIASGKKLGHVPLPLYRYRDVANSLSNSETKNVYDEMLGAK